MQKSILLMLLLIPFASAVYIEANSAVLNTTGSNSSITFSINCSLDYLEIGQDYISILNATTPLKFCPQIDWIAPNANLDSADFCPGTPSGSNSGDTGGLPGEIDYQLCNYTYTYINLYGLNYDYVNEYILKIRDETNITYTWSNLKIYIDNWQSTCSDALNRTLQEEYVCSKINSLLINYPEPSQSQIYKLRDELNITLSNSLIKHYVINYHTLCEKRKPFSIIPITTKGAGTVMFFIILLGLLLIIANHNNKKKKLVASEYKKLF